MNDIDPPLVRLPEKTEHLLYLLREELKAAWFFRHMATVGFIESEHEPFLGSVIFAQMGFAACTDELMHFYTGRIDHHIKKLKPEHERSELTLKALHLYGELRHYRKKKHAELTENEAGA